MIAKFGRLAVAGLLAPLALLASVATMLLAPPANAASDDAVERFGACMNAQKAGQVLIMLDESGSLTATDPQAARVEAADFFVEELEQYAADTGVALEVGVSGFSSDFTPPSGWTRLDPGSLGSVQSQIANFRDRNTGRDTDYWQALNGARQAFADHPGDNPEARPCHALAWFTDGKIDFDTQPGVEKPYAPGVDLGSQEGINATIRAAQQDICRPGGVADQLRTSDIITFGIGLSPEGKTPSDFDVLKSIVTGEQTPTGACGDVVTPRPGEFYLAQNIDDLLQAFHNLGAPGNTPVDTEANACAGGEICDQGKHSFVLDRSVRSVNALATAGAPGLTAVLVPPTGPPQDLPTGAPGTLDFGGVSVNYEWRSEKSVSFRMVNSTAPSWQGQWALVFQNPSGDTSVKTKSSLHISGDLYPAWAQSGDTTLHQGEVVPVTFSVVDGKQGPIDSSALLGTADLTATLVDADGKEHPVANALAKDQISTSQQLDLKDVPLGRATLHMVLGVTTAAATGPDGAAVPGTALSPQAVDLPVVVNAPVGYPAVSASVDFGKLEGVGTRTAELQVKGPGCAWVAGDAPVTVVAGPDGLPTPKITSTANEQSNCTKVDDGDTQLLPLTVEVSQAGNGAVNGTVQVSLAPKDGEGPPVTVDVPFTLGMEKPLDQMTLWIAIVVGLILGPGIPIGLLYLTKWLASRIPGKALRSERIPVRISGNSVLRDNQPFSVRDGELVRLVEGLAGPTRRLAVGDVELRARIGFSPFGAGFVVASAPGLAGAGGRSGDTHKKTPDAKLPLAVQNTWFLLHDPNGPEDAAVVVLLVGGDAGRSVIDRLVAEVKEAVPRVLPDLRRRAKLGAPQNGSTAAPSDSDPFGGNPFGTGGGNAVPSGNPFAGGAPSGSPLGLNSPPPTGNPNPFGAPGSTPPPPRPGSANPDPFGGGSQPGPGPDSSNPFRPN